MEEGEYEAKDKADKTKEQTNKGGGRVVRGKRRTSKKSHCVGGSHNCALACLLSSHTMLLSWLCECFVCRLVGGMLNYAHVDRLNSTL